MSEFRGKQCDSCGSVYPREDNTRRIVRILGPTTSGEYSQDLCPSCVSVPEGVTMRPVRRRTTPTPLASPQRQRTHRATA